MSLRHFLIVFDHQQGKLVRPPKVYENATEALAAYSAMEREHQADKTSKLSSSGRTHWPR